MYPQEAIETFKEALKLKSDFIDAYKSLGQAYRFSDFLLSFLKKNIHISRPVSLFFLCCLRRELGDFDAAMESFQKALMLNQNHIQSLQLRGMMLYHHGSLQEAISNFKVASKRTR